MKNRLVQGRPFLALLAAAAFFLDTNTIFASSTGSEDSAYANIAVFTRALQLLRQDYVDEGRIGYNELIYGAMRGMLSTLDPHSQFMEPPDFQGMQDDTRSEFGGLGVVVSTKDGMLTIISPMEDTPGSRAGLLPGDQILKIDGNPTEKMELSDAVGKLRGRPGEKVTLTIHRPATRAITDFVLERAIIKVASVKGEAVLDSARTGGFKIGYVRITQFNEPTGRDLAAKLDQLEAEGIQALVLDLRNNPGGLLSTAVDVAAEFLPAKQLVVYTEGRAASQRRVYRTPDNAKDKRRYPLAILVNSGSASGSEIVAGALKDLNRAVLVGETTFGKGLVQSVVQLPDGSALRFTTAKYYTPGKQVIQEKGIEPNIRATFTPDQERLLAISRREAAVTAEEQKSVAGFQDTQLDRAIDALKGALIYAQRTDSPAGTPAEVQPKGKDKRASAN